MKALPLTIQKLLPMQNKLLTNKQRDKRADRRTNGHTDGQTDGPKTICPRSIDAGGIKKPNLSKLLFPRITK